MRGVPWSTPVVAEGPTLMDLLVRSAYTLNPKPITLLNLRRSIMRRQGFIPQRFTWKPYKQTEKPSLQILWKTTIKKPLEITFAGGGGGPSPFLDPHRVFIGFRV